MSQDPSQRPAGDAANDGDIDDDIKDAREKFLERFHSVLAPADMSSDARKHVDKIFKRTLHNAIKDEGFEWRNPQNEGRKRFALSRVAEIATRAKEAAGGAEVSLQNLEQAEREVIRKWKPICRNSIEERRAEETETSSPDQEDEVFCRKYNDDGTPKEP